MSDALEKYGLREFFFEKEDDKELVFVARTIVFKKNYARVKLKKEPLCYDVFNDVSNVENCYKIDSVEIIEDNIDKNNFNVEERKKLFFNHLYCQLVFVKGVSYVWFYENEILNKYFLAAKKLVYTDENIYVINCKKIIREKFINYNI